MERSVSKTEVVLLFVCATCCKFAKDIPRLYDPVDNSQYRHSTIFAFIIQYAILDIVLNDYLKVDARIWLVLAILSGLFQVILSYVYGDKIEILANNYYTYYSGYLYALFILLLIASTAYIFNSLIGVDMTNYHHRYF